MFRINSGDNVCVAYDKNEPEAVQIAISNLEADVRKVLNCSISEAQSNDLAITISTVSNESDRTTYKMPKDEKGEWRKEAYRILVEDNTLHILGSDRRGTIYGIYRLSEMLGVSPWYFWADVPVLQKPYFEVDEQFEEVDFPSIEYRGIFINDEEELEKWAKLHMDEDTIGVHTYEKLFELILRLKGNYIWPAMHVNSFNVTPSNGELAQRMGIVVGTSHCDMLMRSNYREWEPWTQKKGYRNAEYDYSQKGKNREILKEYWSESVIQNSPNEVTYTLGMRGIHDSGFETHYLNAKTPEEMMAKKVELLQTVIEDQEAILKENLDHDAVKLFVPYKEVLNLYDSGLRVPEDITLIWTNDNYGYVRRYPTEAEQARQGGNGLYYHNSYWAPPGRSYLFICSIPLEQTKYELEKAYENGIRKLWVMNVGALKPLEQQVEFYFQLAWEIGKEEEKCTTRDIVDYLTKWIENTFQVTPGAKIATLLDDFDRVTNVRKVENMEEDVFSQTAYGDEGAWRVNELHRIYTSMNQIYDTLLENMKPAFFQMILMKVHAAYYTAAMFYFADRSNLCQDQGKDRAADLYTKLTREFDDMRRRMLVYYNDVMMEGKWRGILTPEDYPPPRTAMLPAAVPPLEIAGQGMIVSCMNVKKEMQFDDCEEQWIEIGAAGEAEVEFEIEAPEFLKVSENHGRIATEKRIFIAPKDCNEDYRGKIIIRDLKSQTKEKLFVHVNHHDPKPLYPMNDGMTSVSADSAKADGWRVIPGLGRAIGNLMEAVDVGATISYQFDLYDEVEPLIEIQRYPSLDSTGDIRIEIAVDDDDYTEIASDANDEWRGDWADNTMDNVDKLYVELSLLSEGRHTLHLRAVDVHFAFSRIVIYTEQRQENHLGILCGKERLPGSDYLDEACKTEYGAIKLKPRPTLYAALKADSNTVTKTDLVVEDDCYANPKSIQEIMKAADKLLPEKNGCISIDAITAWMQTEFAYTSGYEWQYCCGETYGRSNLAMYIRSKDLKWTEGEEPGLHYKAHFEGGGYTIWGLVKFATKEHSFVKMAIDGQVFSNEKMYNEGTLWRYEAEQPYRWIPLTTCNITKGQHTVDFFVSSSRIRVERFFLSNNGMNPPTDLDWCKE